MLATAFNHAAFDDEAPLRDLAVLIKTGSADAFAEFVQLSRRIVDRELSMKGVTNRADREDLAQDAYAAFWQKRQQWRLEQAVAYLVGTTRKVAVVYHSNQSRRPDVLASDPGLSDRLNSAQDPGPDVRLIEREEEAAAGVRLSAVLSKMPARLAAVLETRIQGMSPEQAAGFLGITLLEAWDLTLEAVTAAKVAAALPVADPALERRMKASGLWPQDAAPLQVDMGMVIRNQPEIIRSTIYARLSGIKGTEVPEVWGVKVPTFNNRLQIVKRTLWFIAEAFGAIPSTRKRVPAWYVQDWLSIGSGVLRWVAVKDCIDDYDRSTKESGYRLEDLPALLLAVWNYASTRGRERC